MHNDILSKKSITFIGESMSNKISNRRISRYGIRKIRYMNILYQLIFTQKSEYLVNSYVHQFFSNLIKIIV